MQVLNIPNVITEFTQKDDYCQDTLAMLIYTQLVTSPPSQNWYPPFPKLYPRRVFIGSKRVYV